jgi:hypothetical protein
VKAMMRSETKIRPAIAITNANCIGVSLPYIFGYSGEGGVFVTVGVMIIGS